MSKIYFDYNEVLNNEHGLRVSGNTFFQFLDFSDESLDSFIKNKILFLDSYFISSPSMEKNEKRLASKNIYSNFFIRPHFKSKKLFPKNKSFYLKGDFIFEISISKYYFKVKEIIMCDDSKKRDFEKQVDFNFTINYKKASANSVFVRNIIESVPKMFDEENVRYLKKWEDFLEFEKQFFKDKIGYFPTNSFQVLQLGEKTNNLENKQMYKEQIYCKDETKLYIEEEDGENPIYAIEFVLKIKNNKKDFAKLEKFIIDEIELANPKSALNREGKLEYDKNYEFSFSSLRLGGVAKNLEIISKDEKYITCVFSKFWAFEKKESIFSKERIANFISEKYSQNPILLNILSGDIALYKRGKKAIENAIMGDVKNPEIIRYLFNNFDQNEENIKKENFDFSYQSLDYYQKQAITKGIESKGIYLIQGPPGTGKTQTITELVYQFNKRGKKVLISSQTHIAIDNVLERLPDELNILPIRLINSQRKKRTNEEFLPDKLVDNFYERVVLKFEKTINEYKQYLRELEENKDKFENIKEIIFSLQEKIYFLEEKNKNINILDANILRDQEQITSLKHQIKTKKTYLNFLVMVSEKSMENLDEFRQINTNFPLVSDFFELLREKRIIESKHKEESLYTFISIYLNSNKNIDLSKLDEKMEIKKVKKEIKKEEEKLSSMKKSLKEKNIELNSLKDLYNDKRRKNEKKLKKIEEFFYEFFKEYTYENKMPKSDLEKIDLIEKYIREKTNHYEKKKEILNNHEATLKNTIYYIKNNKNLLLEEDRKKYSRFLLNNNSNVFGITCNANSKYLQEQNEYLEELGLGNIDLNKIDFDVVIIDEVSKATFIELLIPILYGKKIILVGDHRQLPPMFKYRRNMLKDTITLNEFKTYEKLVSKSIFKDLFLNFKNNKIMLLNQYRSHEQIMDIVNVFYEGKLKLGYREEQNEAKKHNLKVINKNNNKKLISPNIHTYWFNSHFKDDFSPSYEKKISKGSFLSTSFYNEQEVYLTKNILKQIDLNIDEDKKEIPSIGVISFYKDQVKKLREEVKDVKFNKLNFDTHKISSVDEFQGKEEDIIIVNLVRNNKSRMAGDFTKKFERINVALSRARKILIIIGSKQFFTNLEVEIESLDKKEKAKVKYLYKEIYDKCAIKFDNPNYLFDGDGSDES